jgi:hypothetical protein
LLFSTSLALSRTAQAATINIVMTGAVSNGYDYTGVFGPPNTSLTGQPFTLTYTIDDAQGTQVEACSTVPSFCTSEISGSATSSPVIATLTIGAGSFAFGNGLYSDAQIQTYYSAAGWNSPTGLLMELDVYADIYTTVFSDSLPPGTPPAAFLNFDWRTAFSQQFLPSQTYNHISAGFTIGNASMPFANGSFALTSVTESGFSCSVTPTITIDTSKVGQHPNILLPPDYTTITLSINNATTWHPVVISYLDNAVNVLSPTEHLATTSTGKSSFVYQSAGANANDQVTATSCTSASVPLPVYDYSASFTTGSPIFDIHQSQASDTTFIDTTSFVESNIETFFETTSSYLAHFYLDATNPAAGGWYNPKATGTTDTFKSGYPTYCPYTYNTVPLCPAVNDTGTRAAQLISSAALTNSVNPQVLLATLQKEYGVALKTKRPTDAALNEAMGCGNSDFAAQITCSAQTFHGLYGLYPGATYFFPVNQAERKAYPNGRVTKSIQYSWTTPPAVCNAVKHTNCDLVGLLLDDAATYAQYEYTPFVQTSEGGTRGGV